MTIFIQWLMGYSKSELLLLSKDFLANIILEQEHRLNLSRRGQPKRDNLVGQTFGALTVVGDAGNQQAHSTWYCRCSGNIYSPESQNICDNKCVFWGSNLKADRHQYCGNESCPATRQVLALKRQKELPPEIILQTSEFVSFISRSLMTKFSLMGEKAHSLIEKEQTGLVLLLHNYYGLNDEGSANRLDEISQILDRNDVTKIKRTLESYIEEYKVTIRDEGFDESS